jgi:cobalt-zinc-cadmium efflux system outer membrane protein
VNVFSPRGLLCRYFLILSACVVSATAQNPDLRSQLDPTAPAKVIETKFTPTRPADSLSRPAEYPESSPQLNRQINETETKAINPPKVDPDTLRHLSLDQAIDLLTRNNLSVIASRYNVDLARAQKLVAALRPTATVTVTLNNFVVPRLFKRPRDLFKTDSEAANNTTYAIEYDRLIERGGKRSLRVSQAELNKQAAEALVSDAIRQQILLLKQSFLAAILARENLGVAIDSYGTFEASRTVLAMQVKEGYTAGVDLKRIELQKLQYQRDVSSAEQNFQQSIRDIYNLIGVGDMGSIVDDTTLVNYADPSFVPQMKADLSILDGNLDIEPVVLSVAELRRTALENRPDVKNAELNLEAAKTGYKLALAQQQRDITLGWQYARGGSDNGVGMVATIPVDVKKRADLAKAQAQVNIKLAESQLRLAQTQALTDVEKAFTAYMTSRGRLHLFTDQALVKAFDVRKIEEISYRDGAKGLLDYLDAQHIYNQTLLDYNQARYDFLLSLTLLEAGVGTKLPGK